MQKLTLALLAGLATSTILVAQTPQPVGFMFNMSVGATSRGAMAERPGELLFRIDSSDYAGYGRAQATSPTANDFEGVRFLLQDQYGASIEPYNLHFYGEDPTNPNFPNFAAGSPPGTNALATFNGFNSPTNTTTSPIAWQITQTFTTPVSLPNTGDVFFGVELQASAAANTSATPPYWPNDGLSIQIGLGFQPGATFNVFDLKGAAPVDQTSYGLVHDLNNATFAYGGPRQGAFELMTTGVSGVATAVTNQLTYTISNTPPGTASFFSGLHPDAASPPANPGRVDDLGFVFFNTNSQLPAGSLVFYLSDLGLGAVQIPLSGFVPGSTGVLCLSPAMQTVSLGILSGSRQDFSLPIPTASRVFLPGFKLAFTAIAYNPTTGTLAGGPCAVQSF